MSSQTPFVLVCVASASSGSVQTIRAGSIRKVIA